MTLTHGKLFELQAANDCELLERIHIKVNEKPTAMAMI